MLGSPFRGLGGLLLLLPTFVECQVIDSTRLPIIKIITDNNRFIVNEPRIGADMQIIFHESGWNQPTDMPNDYDGRIAIELRGQTSLSLFDKKSYRLETQNADSTNNNVELLGMPRENDWILYGPYSDKTLIRNVLAYEISRRIGQYAARTKLVELIINDDYQGVYILSENIKRDNDRVDLKKMDADDIAGDSLTGGYIFRTDKFDFNDFRIFPSKYSDRYVRNDYQVIYPKEEDITDEQLNYIIDYFYAFEDATFGDDFRDSVLGFRNFIDEQSFMDHFFINEIARNPDAYRISAYFHKKRDSEGGKIHAGPVWDFNLGFGNVNFCAGPDIEGWILNYHQHCPNDFWQVPAFWDRLFSDSDFSQATVDRWKELRLGTLKNENIMGIIDSLATLLEAPQERNFEKWPVLGEQVWPNAFVGRSFDAEISELRRWLGNRLWWMDSHMENISLDVKGNFSRVAFQLYPNPVVDNLNIRIQVQEEVGFQFRLFDSMGHRVSEWDLETTPGQLFDFQFDDSIISRLSQGVYFLQIFRGEEMIETRRVLKL